MPVPEGATAIKTQPCGWPLTNLYVFRLDYGSFELTFQHTNKRIALGEQMQAGLSGSAIPGSTLENEVNMWLAKPVAPTWEYVKPRLLKPHYDKLVYYTGSKEGHVELERTSGEAKFWSPRAWVAKKASKIKVEANYNLKVPGPFIKRANFLLNVIGTGELDAFLQYAAKSAIPAESKK